MSAAEIRDRVAQIREAANLGPGRTPTLSPRLEIEQLRGRLATALADRDFAIGYAVGIEGRARAVVRVWNAGLDPSTEIEALARALDGHDDDDKRKGQHMTDTEERRDPEPTEEPAEEPSHEGPGGPEPEREREPE